jgi:thiamine pyrophosphate-dependent acetolactate synthase large subunit-like protein
LRGPFSAAGTNSATSHSRISRVVIRAFSHAVESRPSTSHYDLRSDSDSRFPAR